MRTTNSFEYDVSIDGKWYILENMAEVEHIENRAERFKGIDFKVSPRDLLLRFWSESDEVGQRRIERRKNKYGIDFKRERGRGMQ